MTATTLNHVSFKILLQQHGGNYARAMEAWKRICQLGRFGDVPHTYEGGLDVKSLHIALDEQRQHQSQAEVLHAGEAGECGLSPTLSDDIKRIEDLAAGDRPTN